MRNKILFFIPSLGLLLISFLFFINAYQKIIDFTALLERRNNVYNHFQELSRQITNAAVINPDLLQANEKGLQLFLADSATVIESLAVLKTMVTDSVNTDIINKISEKLTAELPWLLKSNVPDSIIHHTSAGHIQQLKDLTALTLAGTRRTALLIEQQQQQLHSAITKEKIWMVIFIAVAVGMLAYTMTNLYRQKFKIKAAEDELKNVFNRINDAVVSVDNDWRYTFLNDAALANHPKGKAQTLGKGIWDIHPEMKGTIFWDKYHEAMVTKKVVEVESYYEPMDTWFSVKVYPSSNGLTIFYKDITGYKKKSQQLFETKKEVADYKYALDESSIVAITDQKGIINYVNENFCKISKYSREELIGQDHRIINSGFHSADFIKNLWTTIAHGKIWKGELKNKAKDGTIYWVDTTIVPFLDLHGKPYQYIAIRSDITERKEFELSLVHINQDLQKQTKELARSNEELEQFAFVASHDLQEPLRMVTNFLTQLEVKYADVFDKKATGYIRFAVDGAKRMRQIILDLLEFSRVGKTADDKVPVDVKQVVSEVQILFSRQIAEKNAIIHTKGLPVIQNYSGPVNQVFQNLISNALKYNDKAPVINIVASDAGTHWQFEVADNGIGINEEYFEKIFIIFQRLHGKDEFGGTGLGLAITKKIIESLGGRIWITSEEGKGSTFYFTIEK